MAAVAPPVAITVADDVRSNRYELRVNGELAAAATYQLVPGRIVFRYTELMPGFEGQRLGGQLAGLALADIRRRGLRVVPRCPFIATYIEDHPDYRDLLDSPVPDSVSA
jgi:uncharacterized protein